MSFYKEFRLDELRQLVLYRQIDTSLIEKVDYERIFNNEIDLKDPDINILNFCIDGLKIYEDYKFDFGANHLNEIKEKYYKRSNSKNKRKYKIIKRLLTAAIIIIALMTFQFVSLAFGFNIFNYIFNWNDDPDAVIVQGVHENLLHDFDNDTEYIYETVEQIPKSIKNIIPNSIYKNNIIEFTYLYKSENYIFITFNFELFTINLSSVEILLWEKDDIPYVTDIINGIEYNYFSNLDINCCLWEYDGFVYKVETAKPIDELEKIVALFNQKKED